MSPPRVSPSSSLRTAWGGHEVRRRLGLTLTLTWIFGGIVVTVFSLIASCSFLQSSGEIAARNLPYMEYFRKTSFRL